MCSIFEFFADLAEKKALLKDTLIDDFPFNENMVLFEWTGKFPDMVLRRNTGHFDNPLLSGGELIEMKNSEGIYTVSSFNSTIPSGEKKMVDIMAQKGFAEKMAEVGDDAGSLPVRQVYYLVRGKKRGAVKVCLVHGSFFATVEEPDLVSDAFRQVMEEAILRGKTISPKAKKELLSAMTERDVFAATRQVKKASVSLRFRVMTEVRSEANIMRYDEILDNTLNFIVPMHGKTKKAIATQESKIIDAAQTTDILNYPNVRQFRIKHPFNGWFWALQIPI